MNAETTVGSGPRGRQPLGRPGPEIARLVVLVQARLLRGKHRLVQRGGPPAAGTVSMGQDVDEQDPSVATGLFEGDLAWLEEPHQRRPRVTEHVGGLAGGENGLARSHRDRQLTTEVVRDITQNLEHFRGEPDVLPVRSH